MKILHIGRNHGTTAHRFQALKRLGHDVTLIDPFTFFSANRLLTKWVYETGAWGLEKIIGQRMLSAIASSRFDYALVDGGYVIGPELVRSLKKKVGFVANYNVDDPFSPSEWRKWRLYRESIPYYDLLVVVREQNVQEAKNFQAKYVYHVFRTADEVAHKPVPLAQGDQELWGAQVAFVGTWMPERGPFMARLIQRGVPLSIWGDRWQKAREWDQIKSAWRGPGVFNENYNRIVQCSQICLGLLSKGNRDLHTQRSAEIPALGGLFCAERTTEHQQMYVEGQEAFFWDHADECADICLRLLNDRQRCKDVARQGHERSIKNGYFNEPMLKNMIAFASQDAKK